MRRYAPQRIRNVALVGHHGSGKTTLAEALLHTAGAIPRRGRVEDGTTTTDHEPEEHERQMSLSLSLAPFEWRDHKVNLLDVPGEADCTGALQAALGVADLAVVVVSAVEGVEAQTEAAWHLAAELGVPRLVFVNKLDRERADFDRVVDQLRDRFGSGFAVLELPIGKEADLHGVVDVLSETAELYDGGAHTHAAPVPDDMADREHAVHDQVVEEIVAGDDELLERFLVDDVPSVEELEHALTVEMEHQVEFPVLCGSALTDIARRPAGGLPGGDRPAAVGPARHRHRRRHRGRGPVRPRRRSARPRLPHHQRPLRRAPVALPGAVGQRQVRRPPHQQPHRWRRAPPRPLHAAGQGARGGRRAWPPATSGWSRSCRPPRRATRSPARAGRCT